jgi:lysozyme
MQENKEVRMARSIEHLPECIAQIKRHEGLRLEAYRCPVGVLTIGWGHNCDASPIDRVQKVGDVISLGTAEVLLSADMALVANEIDRRLPWWRELDAPRQAVLLNMGFQLGVSGLCKFAKMLHAVEAGDWNEAGRQMLDSKWATQTRSRAAELSTQMVLGTWQEG